MASPQSNRGQQPGTQHSTAQRNKSTMYHLDCSGFSSNSRVGGGRNLSVSQSKHNAERERSEERKKNTTDQKKSQEDFPDHVKIFLDHVFSWTRKEDPCFFPRTGGGCLCFASAPRRNRNDLFRTMAHPKQPRGKPSPGAAPFPFEEDCDSCDMLSYLDSYAHLHAHQLPGGRPVATSDTPAASPLPSFGRHKPAGLPHRSSSSPLPTSHVSSQADQPAKEERSIPREHSAEEEESWPFRPPPGTRLHRPPL
jgi:hypothetical protein